MMVECVWCNGLQDGTVMLDYLSRRPCLKWEVTPTVLKGSSVTNTEDCEWTEKSTTYQRNKVVNPCISAVRVILNSHR